MCECVSVCVCVRVSVCELRFVYYVKIARPFFSIPTFNTLFKIIIMDVDLDFLF